MKPMPASAIPAHGSKATPTAMQTRTKPTMNMHPVAFFSFSVNTSFSYPSYGRLTSRPSLSMYQTSIGAPVYGALYWQ